jgi:hypothetical protein
LDQALAGAGATIVRVDACRPKISSSLVSRVIAGEAIVVPIRRGAADMDSIFAFNETGTALWKLIEQNQSGAEMIAFLEREYGISVENATADTERFLTDLAEAGLIEIC